MIRVTGISAVLVVSGVCSASPLGGGGWEEGPYNMAPWDAGETLATMRVVSNASGSVLGSFKGQGDNSLWGGDDLADLLEVNVTDPTNFKISAISTESDTQLFLFRKVTVGGVPILRALLCCDNTSTTNNEPAFDNTGGYWNGTHYLNPMTSAMASVGESFTPGRYVIGISHSNLNPYAGSGAGTALFNVPATGLGVRSSTLALSFWRSTVGLVPTHGDWWFLNWYSGVRYILADSYANAEWIYGPGTHSINTAASNESWYDCGVAMGHCVFFRLFWTSDEYGWAVTTCGTVNFDSVIEVTEIGTSPAWLGCNDDAPGCGLGSRVLACPFQPGGDYRVTVGSYQGGFGGSGTISFEPLTPPPSPDLNRDGRVNAEDLAILIGGWTGQ